MSLPRRPRLQRCNPCQWWSRGWCLSNRTTLTPDCEDSCFLVGLETHKNQYLNQWILYSTHPAPCPRSRRCWGWWRCSRCCCGSPRTRTRRSRARWRWRRGSASAPRWRRRWRRCSPPRPPPPSACPPHRRPARTLATASSYTAWTTNNHLVIITNRQWLETAILKAKWAH